MTDLCWHDCGRKRSLLRTLWHSTKTSHFWNEVQNILSLIINGVLPLKPEICSLGIQVNGVKYAAIRLLTTAFLSVKRIILLNCDTRKPIAFV